MFYKMICCLIAVAAVLSIAPSAPAQGRREGPRREREVREHQRLYDALAELREARAELRDSRGDFRGHKEKALAAIDDSIGSLKTMLRIRRDEDIPRLARGRDFYRAHRDYPHLRQAVKDLRMAREYLEGSRADFGELKERAMRDMRLAIEQIEAGLEERR
jgi:hypothetical protein